MRGLFLLFFLPCFTAVAQEEMAVDTEGLTVEYQLGLGNRQFLNTIQLALFQIHNQTGKPIEGTLELHHVRKHYDEWKAYSSATASFPLKLGQESKQRFSLNTGLVGLSNPLVRLRLRDHHGHILWQRLGSLETAGEYPDWRLRVLTLDSRRRQIAMGPVGPAERIRILHQQARSRFRTFAAGERDVDFIHTKPWTIPSDFSHLNTFDAILLGDLSVNALSDQQWQTLADYLAHDGVVIVSSDRTDLEERLLERLPFDPPSADDRDVPVGHGRLLRFSPDALQAEGGSRENHRWIYDRLDLRIKPVFPDALMAEIDRSAGTKAEGVRAEASRQRLVLFALAFALLTGPVMWVFRRWPRRRVLCVLASVVTVFSLLAIVIGHMLSRQRGELWWTTLTHIPQKGGALQDILFEAESAGAKTHALILNDPKANLRDLEVRATLDLHELVKEQGSIDTRILPWTKRFLKADAYAPNLKPLECRVELAASPHGAGLYLDNPNDFEILSAKILIQGTAERFQPEFAHRAASRQARRMTMHVEGMIMAPSLVMGKKLPVQLRGTRYASLELTGELVSPEGYVETLGPKATATRLLKRSKIQTAKDYCGFLILQIDRSPAVQLEGGDFVATSGAHYLIQELGPEQLPPYETFFVPYEPMVGPEQPNRMRINMR